MFPPWGEGIMHSLTVKQEGQLTITLLEDSAEKAENMATRSVCMIQGLIFESLCKNVF